MPSQVLPPVVLRPIGARLVALVSLLLVLLPAAMAASTTPSWASSPSVAAVQGPYPPVPPTVTVDRSNVTSCGCVTLAGSDFKPGTQVSVKDNGTPVGTAKVRSDGTFSYRICYRDPASSGQHTISVTGDDTDGQQVTDTVRVDAECRVGEQPLQGSGGGAAVVPGGGAVVVPVGTPTPGPGALPRVPLNPETASPGVGEGCAECIPFWRHPVSEVLRCWRWLLLLLVFAGGGALGYWRGRRDSDKGETVDDGPTDENGTLQDVGLA